MRKILALLLVLCSSSAFAQSQLKAGLTSRTVDVFIQDSSSTTGAGLGGLVYNTANLVCSYKLNRGARVAITLATQTVTGAWSSGGFVEIDATNMKGLYRLDLPDAAVASGAHVIVECHGATNAAQMFREIQLQSLDVEDAVRAGLTFAPNVASGSAGAIPTTGTGANQISVTSGVVLATDHAGANLATAAALTTVDTVVDSILVDTAEIGAAGAGLTALGDTRIANLDAAVSGRMATYTQPTGFLAATFPGTVASTTNITGGTITTTTNLTNLPTIPTAWITADGIATDAIGAAEIAVGAIAADAFAAGAIDAAAIAADAIGSSELATTAVVEMNAIISDTADSGTTTTLVDAARTEAEADYWAGSWLLITSGTTAGQVRRISAFTPGTDTITVASAFTQAIGTNTYEILRTSGTEAPGAGATDWSAGEKSEIRYRLSMSGSQTDPATTTGGVEVAAGAITATEAPNLDAAVSSRSTLTQTQVTGGAYSMASASQVLGDTRIANLDAAVSSRSTLGGTAQTGDSYAIINSGTVGLAVIEAQTDDIGVAGAGLTDLGGMSTTMKAQVEAEVDDSLGSGTGAALTAIPWNASWDTEVQSEVQDAIEGNHLDHLLAVDYDPASKPGTATALLNELIESDAGVSRYTANALEEAPSGGGGGLDAAATRAALGMASANLDTQLSGIQSDTNLYDTDAERATAAWGAVAASYNTAGSMGQKLNAAGGAADPLLNAVPGSYAVGTAGYNLGYVDDIHGQTILLSCGSTTISSSVATDDALTITRGDSYGPGGGNPAITWTRTGWPDYTSYTSARVSIRTSTGITTTFTASIPTVGSGSQTISLSLTSAETTLLRSGKYDVEVRNGTTWTSSPVVGGVLTVSDDLTR